MQDKEVRIVEQYPAPKFLDQRAIPANTVLLDVRNNFDYISSHVDTAYWQDYRYYMKNKSTWPKQNYQSVAQSLSRKGISSDTNVLVLDAGQEGQGEACRVAWTLYYMGLNKVSFLKESFLSAKRTRQEVSLPKKRAEIWFPKVRKNISLNKKQLLKMIKAKKNLRLLDVRPENKYLHYKYSWDPEVDMAAINIYWKDFLDKESGLPNRATISRLHSLGWRHNDDIIVVDDIGLGGACAVMSLWSAGYQNVRYYPGGYQSLKIGKN